MGYLWHLLTKFARLVDPNFKNLAANANLSYITKLSTLALQGDGDEYQKPSHVTPRLKGYNYVFIHHSKTSRV